VREYYCDSIDSYRLAARSKTYDNIEVFSGVDLATTQVPADGRRGSDTASDLTHEQVGLVVDWSGQWYCARKPVLTVVSHLISVQSPRVVYDIDTASLSTTHSRRFHTACIANLMPMKKSDCSDRAVPWGRCSVGRVGHGPPKILAGWATIGLHLAPPIIGLYVRR